MGWVTHSPSKPVPGNLFSTLTCMYTKSHVFKIIHYIHATVKDHKQLGLKTTVPLKLHFLSDFTFLLQNLQWLPIAFRIQSKFLYQALQILMQTSLSKLYPMHCPKIRFSVGTQAPHCVLSGFHHSFLSKMPGLHSSTPAMSSWACTGAVNDVPIWKAFSCYVRDFWVSSITCVMCTKCLSLPYLLTCKHFKNYIHKLVDFLYPKAFSMFYIQQTLKKKCYEWTNQLIL